MLTKPNIAEAEIAGQLAHVFGIDTYELAFLPLGADANTVNADDDYSVSVV